MRTRRRTPLAAGAALVLGVGITIPLAAQPVAQAAADSLGWCTTAEGDGRPAPCVIALERNGADARSLGYDVHVRDVAVGSKGLIWEVSHSGDVDLGATARAERWTVTLEMGTATPRVTFTKGKNVTVRRIGTGLIGTPPRASTRASTHRVEITANPVRVTDNDECVTSTWPWVCPHRATKQSQAYFGGEITDYGAWRNTAQRNAMYGMDYATNIAATSVPPEVTVDAATGRQQLMLRLANQHEYPDGTPFRGFTKLRIPNTFLAQTYGIDDPSTLTSAGLRTTLGSGTVSVRPGTDAIEVDASGITFSARTLTIRQGKVVPKAPTKVKTKRTKAKRARVTFKQARARGSKVTGYAVRCKATKSKHVVRAATGKRKAVVKKLKKNRAYTCQVRARSAAGQGPWSKPKKVKQRVKGRR